MKSYYCIVFIFSLLIFSDFSSVYADDFDLEIKARDDRYTFCHLDTIILYHNHPNSDDFQFAWYRIPLDGTQEAVVSEYKDFGQDDTLSVYRSGVYRLEIRDRQGNVISSNRVTIEVVQKPRMILFVNGMRIDWDENISICPDDEVLMKAEGGEKQKWYYVYDGDTSLINIGQTILAKNMGTYFAVGDIQDLCFDTTFYVNLFLPIRDLEFSRKHLHFVTGLTYPTAQELVTITNKGHIEVELAATDFFSTNPGIVGVLDVFPLRIAPTESKDIFVRFQPLNFGDYSEQIRIKVSCDLFDTIYITARHTPSRKALIQSDTIVDFGINLACNAIAQHKEIVIRNNHNVPLIVEPLTLAPPFYFANAEFGYPSLPFTIEPSKSISIAIRFFAGTNEGSWNIKYKANVTLSDGRLFDSLMLNLKAINIRPDFELVPNFIDFGNLDECQSFKDTIIHIKNTGNFTITLREKITDQSFEMLDISNQNPIVILPKDSAQIKIRFAPKVAGDFDSRFAVPIAPCAISKIINLVGSKSDGFVFVSDNTIDFGKRVFCNEEFELTRIIKIYSNATSGAEYTIDDIIVSDNISLEFPDGNTLFENDSINVIVNLKVKDNKSIDEIVKFKTFPCNEEFQISVKLDLDTINYSYTEIADFGVDYISNTFAHRAIIFRNISNVSIEISNIDDIQPPFSLVGNIQFPIIVQANSEQTFNFNFSPNFPNKFRINPTFVINNPCQKRSSFELLGEAILDTLEKGNFSISIKGQRKALNGEFVRFPIALSGDSSYLANGYLKQLSFAVNYDETLLFPERYITNPLWSDYIENVSFQESNMGILEIDIIFKEPALIGNNPLLEVEFTALTGDMTETNLWLSNPKWISSKIILEVVLENDAIFEIEEDCILENNRLVKITDLIFRLYYPNKSKIEIQAKAVADEPLYFEIYDMLGKVHYTYRIDNPDTDSIIVLELSSSSLPAGGLFARYKNADVVKIIKFMNER